MLDDAAVDGEAGSEAQPIVAEVEPGRADVAAEGGAEHDAGAARKVVGDEGPVDLAIAPDDRDLLRHEAAAVDGADVEAAHAGDRGDGDERGGEQGHGLSRRGWSAARP
jgi:hypothetical protein